MPTTNWGLKPVLFTIENIPIDAYSVFVFLGIAIGAIIYFFQLKSDGIKNNNAMYIAIFALVGGAVGAKLPLLFMYWNKINANEVDIYLSGRTIIGGLLGGAIGTFSAKKLFKIKQRMGNQLAIPVAVGMAIGRIGCLLKGCCYGKPTNSVWGVDFGDNILRHPTQIYEMTFDFLLAGYLFWRKKQGVESGQLFTIFLNFYLGFRFIIEFIRVEQVAFWGLTDFQILCMVSLLYINRRFIFSHIKKQNVEKQTGV